MFHNSTVHTLPAYLSTIHIFIWVHIDTFDHTQPCWPHLSCHLISIVYIDTSDPTRNCAALVCHAIQQYGAYRHIRPNMQPFWPCLSCHLISENPVSWRCNQSIQFAYDPALQRHTAIQALIGNVSYVCLCKYTNMNINNQIIKTINSQQTYIIMSKQHLNNQIARQIVTKQWPFTTVKNSLTAAENLNN